MTVPARRRERTDVWDGEPGARRTNVDETREGRGSPKSHVSSTTPVSAPRPGGEGVGPGRLGRGGGQEPTPPSEGIGVTCPGDAPRETRRRQSSAYGVGVTGAEQGRE